VRICKIWDAEYPWDVRAEKVCRALTEAGHDVHLVARNRDERVLEERLPECTVHRLAPLPAVGRRLSGASMFPAFFNPRWWNKIREVSARIRARLILVRDLPLAPTALGVARSLGLALVMDMAENYPAMIRGIYDNDRQRFIDYVVRNPAVVSAVERWTLPRVDHVLVVVEESRDRLADMGIPNDRMTIVGNTPPLGRLAQFPGPEGRTAPVPSASTPIRLAYLGLMEAPRGIGTLLRACAICDARGFPVRLDLIGDGRDRADFEQDATALGLDPTRVRFHGAVPNAEALGMLADADAGIIPHHADASWNSTIPNKLFDYMAAGLPVVGSNATPVERVIHETGCGVVVRDRDPVDLANALGRLVDPVARRRYAEAGRRGIASRYNWETDSARLLAALDETVDRARRRGDHG
jgi:glycosyltransferase involved in cell wall biosynthesis